MQQGQGAEIIPVATGVVGQPGDGLGDATLVGSEAGPTTEQIVGARPGVARKPDPVGAFDVTTALGVDPTACWFLGDSDVDMQTAVNAGMKPVGVLWGFRSESELRNNGAELLLSQPSELLMHLDLDAG